MSIARYRKKPVVIEAAQVGEEDYVTLVEWCGGRGETRDGRTGHPVPVIAIDTLEGTMLAYPGDWVIRGLQGEFYPCKSAIFEATYEPTDDYPVCEACGAVAHGNLSCPTCRARHNITIPELVSE